nr:hypothetical protein [uncultured Shuttleworthia sp.]
MAEIFADERRPVFVCVDHLDQVLAYACVDCEDQVLTYAFCVMKKTRGDAVMVDYFLSLKKRRSLWTSWPAAALGGNSSFLRALRRVF